MNPKAIAKSRDRLNAAKRAIEELDTCGRYSRFREVWYNFLVSSKSVYTILEQGAKSSSASIKWFENKSDERRADDLLKYIYEARNCDEHGLEPVSEYVPPSLSLGVQTPGSSRAFKDENGNVFFDVGTAYQYVGDIPDNIPKFESLDGKPVMMKVTPPHAKLNKVFNRKGVPIAPPTKHLGQQITDLSPKNIARLTVEYLEQLIAEADSIKSP